MAVAQLTLIREEGGALHEEDRERRHTDIGDRIGRVDPPALVGEACAALAQVAEEGFEALHMDLESEIEPLANPLSGRAGRLSSHCGGSDSVNRSPGVSCNCDSSALRTAAGEHRTFPFAARHGTLRTSRRTRPSAAR